jgi:hypothetical protein
VTAPGGKAVEPRVGIKQVLSSLVLLVKDGGGLPDLQLVSQDAGKNFWRLPEAVVHRFRNAGGVHVVPRGLASVRDPMGRVVARGALNEGSGVILPESFRRYTTRLNMMAGAWWPGRYEIKTEYRYDGTDKTKTLVTGFWYGGSPVVWVAGLFVVVAGAALAWWLFVRPRRKRRAT